MADENANQEVPFEKKQAVGAPEGVTNGDLSEGEVGNGPAAPVINNTAPKKEPTAEEKAAAEKAEADKATAEKEAADKKVADEKAEADKKIADEAAEKAELEASKKEYPVYNDEAADAVVSILKEAGVTPEESDSFFRAAVESGKLEDIDVGKLTEKVGKEKASLIMIGVKDFYNRNTQEVKKVVDEVYKVVGGEEQLATVKNWALEKEKTDPAFKAELDEYRAMLNSTPVQARLAISELLKAYNADPKTSSLKVTITEGDSAGSGQLSLDYISRADYVKEMKVAEDKRDTGAQERLRARRTQSIAQEKQRN